MLYRGSVAEAGGVDLVVGRPQHPYTQLLIQSVPEPDPGHPWGAVEIRTDVGEGADTSTQVVARPRDGHLLAGCTFAHRCPHVMQICRDQVPPLYRLDPARAAACFLYQDRSALALEDPNEVMSAAASGTPTP